jgi:hypothetical protein
MTVPTAASGRDVEKKRGIAAMSSANEALFKLAITILGIALLGSFLHHKVSLNGIDLTPRISDIPLLLGLLVIFIGNFNYYKALIEPHGESPQGALLSLGGMLVMALLPIVILVDTLLPWRFFVIGLYALLATVKNFELSRRFATHETAVVFRIWRRRAGSYFLAAIVFGCVFFCLTNIGSRRRLFDRIIDCPNLSFKPAYEWVVNVIFNLTFLLSVLVLFILHHRDLEDLRFSVADIK